MAENDRTPREQASRAKQQRYVYTPSSALPEPTPEPGIAFRWIATHILGVLDPNNVSKRLREGWEPCKAEDYPELHIPGNKDGNVEIGGLMLCKMPKEMADARDEYYQKQARNQMESVDNHFMRNQDARMPLFTERKTEVGKGRGAFGDGKS